ncbi:hypothetical protein SCHPADRAFT_186550 [Schizopora paradoxa]|uniref:ditrans,polycis-polyprenyl diphosphate synthase [(2E,6E)-farnesyldiphosphate specific] n=1 Tax=Schizopora paradoxa TaxID=27342 RepID=A0A0H2RY85_9AGAM|nr:hypothetical protein SCHPADRAFT_186550 [Schizopora paradoxa]
MTRGTSMSRLEKLRAPALSTPTAFTNRTRRRWAQRNMKALARLILAIVHAFYTFWTLAASHVRLARKADPHPLEYPRRQTPKHLALVLVTEDGRLKNEEEETYVCNTVADVVGWSKAVGIESLSVYNRQGVLYKYAETIREMLSRPSHFESGQEDAESNSESELEFPLTPPPSDHSISRPLSRSDLRGHSNHVICMSLEGHQHDGEISGVKHRTSCTCKISTFWPILMSFVHRQRGEILSNLSCSQMTLQNL